MTDNLDQMLTRARAGRMSRREFMGRTTAMGVSAGIASALFAKVARADEPVRGGTMRLGLSGGESTNSLDPALAASPAPNVTAQTWGEKAGRCHRRRQHRPAHRRRHLVVARRR